jgi:hypothetical protein
MGQWSENRLSRHVSAGQWFTSTVTPDTMAAWRTAPSTFTTAIKARLPFKEIDLAQAIPRGYVSVQHEDGYRSVWIFLKAGSYYDLMKDYRRAMKRGRVDTTPHGWFWGLPSENFELAARFLNNFGPLGQSFTVRLDGGDEYAWLDLGDFWNKQLRFKTVTKLWITLEDIRALRESWAELGAQLARVDAADDFPVGSILMPKDTGHVELDLTILRQLRDLVSTGGNIKGWLENDVDASTIRRETISLVEGELHGQLRQLARWRRVPGTMRPGFELTLAPNTLWSALWYLFALDTQSGVGWRICPHHQRLFYPPRSDRFYCTTEEQTQHSRLAWWEKHKGPELEKRRKARRRLRNAAAAKGTKR